MQVIQKEVRKIKNKSKAEYMRDRRKNKKTFSVLLENEKYDQIDKRLNELNKTKKEWLVEKIDEETKK